MLRVIQIRLFNGSMIDVGLILHLVQIPNCNTGMQVAGGMPHNVLCSEHYVHSSLDYRSLDLYIIIEYTNQTDYIAKIHFKFSQAFRRLSQQIVTVSQLLRDLSGVVLFAVMYLLFCSLHLFFVCYDAQTGCHMLQSTCKLQQGNAYGPFNRQQNAKQPVNVSLLHFLDNILL